MKKEIKILFILFFILTMGYVIVDITILSINDLNQDKKRVRVREGEMKNSMNSFDRDQIPMKSHSNLGHEILDLPVEYRYSYEFGLVRSFIVDQTDMIQIIPTNNENHRKEDVSKLK